MGPADFKSVVRCVDVSWVGSIPTHFRHFSFNDFGKKLMDDRYRRIPKMDKLLQRDDVKSLIDDFGRPYVVDVLRNALDDVKSQLKNDNNLQPEDILENKISLELLNARLNPLGKVVNATGIILHTNLGRAPISPEILLEATANASGACGLEIDMVDGKRGVRGRFVRETLARLCGAEDALVVNNNAAALIMILSCLAKGKNVIISRGELIQIGGGFRIPEIISQGGATLKEVGTTNITTLQDYEQAIDENTGALIKVHLSNFHQDGFAKRPSTSELARLKTSEIPFIEDLGSGNLMKMFGKYNLPDPTPADVIRDGADLVCFSGDKLLGGCQAGLIAGKKELIGRLAKFPLMRAVRPDKFTYSLLQVVFKYYERGEVNKISPWKQISKSRAELTEKISAFRKRFSLDENKYQTIETYGEFGAGSLPGKTIESAALSVCNKNTDKVAEWFRRSDPPVVGVINSGRFLLDFLALDDADLDLLGAILVKFDKAGLVQ